MKTSLYILMSQNIVNKDSLLIRCCFLNHSVERMRILAQDNTVLPSPHSKKKGEQFTRVSLTQSVQGEGGRGEDKVG